MFSDSLTTKFSKTEETCLIRKSFGLEKALRGSDAEQKTQGKLSNLKHLPDAAVWEASFSHQKVFLLQ